jgi:hypothetical protein
MQLNKSLVHFVLQQYENQVAVSHANGLRLQSYVIMHTVLSYCSVHRIVVETSHFF